MFREYNDVVRAVARERGTWRLIDLDALVSARSDVRDVFNPDGICFSKAGQALIADIEARYIRDHFLAPSGN
jgi:hypothetical protein